MSKYKIVIFDWDGTLMDSIDMIVKTFLSAAADLNIENPSAQRIRSYIGLNVMTHIEDIFPGVAKNQYIESYKKHRIANFRNMKLFDGVLEFLQQLKSTNHILAVATSRNRHEFDPVLEDLQLTDMFAATRCANDGHPKPNPQMLWGILDETGFKKEDAIMVGDSEHDMKLANNANIDALAVSYGVQNEGKLLQHNPVKCVDTIEQLKTFFL